MEHVHFKYEVVNNFLGRILNVAFLWSGWIQHVRIAMEIAAGIYCLHQLGIIHRDIAPRNILIDSTFHAKIADFGLAINESELEEEVKKKKKAWDKSIEDLVRKFCFIKHC